MKSWIRKLLKIVLVIVLLGFVIIQFIPYGRDHSNPPVVQEPNWDSPQTRELVVRACYDCHSNEVVWPWYSNVAPFSWMITNDVIVGRREVNFSEWTGRGGGEVNEFAGLVRSGYMPPSNYLVLHPGARLSAEETDQLIQGLTATLRQ